MATEYKLSYTASEIDEKLEQVDINKTNINQLSNEIGDVSKDLIQLEEKIFGKVEYEERVTSDNKFDNIFDENGKINLVDGTNSTSETMIRSSKFYDIGEEFSGVLYIATSSGSDSDSGYSVSGAFYDKDKNFIKYFATGNGKTEPFYTSTGAVNNARYFRVCKTATYEGLVYVSTINPGSAENANYEYTSEMVNVGGEGVTIGSNKKLEGKVVVNFGDSIFGKRRPPEDISTKLAELTGATVYNCGFGGCHMSNHWATTYNAFSMCNLADAIVTGNWTTQNNAIADTSSNAVPSYFAEALEILKGLDFEDVDIVTIAYGTNDFTNGDVLENANNLYDVESYSGALRHSVETLLTTYPHLKIFICSQTYRFWIDDSNVFTEDSDTKVNTNNVKLTDFVEKTKEIAEEYHLPYINNYDIGMNKFNRSRYFSATDGTHPIITGCHLIAEHMANELF